MSDLRAICDAARAARARGEPLFMATVVRAKGSSYRRPGARLLFASDRPLAGSISGGCLERDVLARGEYLTREGASIVSYDSTQDDEVGVRTALGCGGVVDVLIERLDPTDGCNPLDFLDRIVGAQQRGVLATVVRSRSSTVPVGSRFALIADTTRASFKHAQTERELAALAERVFQHEQSGHYAAQDGAVEAFVEFVRPPPHLFVFGSNHDVVPLITLARSLGWQVISVDHQERFSTRELLSRIADRLIVPATQMRAHIERCDRPLAVIMSHQYEYDRELLRVLLGSRALYVGVLGPKRRAARMLDELARSGFVARGHELDRLFAPAGLALGAEGPEEIALSIAAELQGVLTGTPPVALREVAPTSRASEPDFAMSAE